MRGRARSGVILFRTKPCRVADEKEVLKVINTERLALVDDSLKKLLSVLVGNPRLWKDHGLDNQPEYDESRKTTYGVVCLQR
jgi:hypothetical protein